MNYELVDKYLLSYDGSTKSYPFDKKTAVYSVVPNGETESEMFALIEEGKSPVRLSLKCDPKLSKLLRDKYETVMPGNRLNQNLWNTVLLTGQLDWEEIKGLIRLSYDLVALRKN